MRKRFRQSLNESDLSENEKLRLYEFIAKNRSTFAKDTSELVGSNVHKHKIITGQAPPQHKRPYRVSPQIKQLMDEQIDDMLENDIIEPSSSYWAAPVVMCKKKIKSHFDFLGFLHFKICPTLPKSILELTSSLCSNLQVVT